MDNKKNKYVSFDRWFPVNCDYISELATLTRVCPTARIIFDVLGFLCDSGNNIKTSYTELSCETGLSRQIISKSINVLEDFGFISTSKDGASTIFSLNPLVIKKTYAVRVLENSLYSGKPCAIPDYAMDRKVRVENAFSAGFIRRSGNGKAKSLVNDIRKSILEGKNKNGK